MERGTLGEKLSRREDFELVVGGLLLDGDRTRRLAA
jgi:hypothetical protein